MNVDCSDSDLKLGKIFGGWNQTNNFNDKNTDSMVVAKVDSYTRESVDFGAFHWHQRIKIVYK